VSVPAPSRRREVQDRARRARGERTGELSHDLALFVGLLRELGAVVSPAATLQALRALAVVPLDRRNDVRTALRACVTSSAQELAVFDAVFGPFWDSDAGSLVTPAAPDSSGEGDTVPGSGDGAADTVQEAAPGEPGNEGPAGRATYSRMPGRSGGVRARQRRDIEGLAHQLARALGTARGHREEPARRGERIDLPASLRANLSRGGEIVELRHTRRRRNRARLVVFWDVSSSMRPSTPLFLAFVHALTSRVRRVETAVFNVDTVLVTEVFRRMDLRSSLRWLAHQQVALSGGTRIGHCLHAFLDDVEPRGSLGRNTIALILSDGWDVGEPDLLLREMRRLRGSVGRIVWCDPHAAASGYSPQVQGLQVALPFVDDYLDLSGVGSLVRLVDHLASPVSSRRALPSRSPH
jgi:uncharacterized protein with von Willebrand factor type A (vWA) domain